MKNQNEAVDYFWQTGWFEKFRKPKEIRDKIEKDWGIYVENIIPTLKLAKFKKKIKKFPKGWKQIRTPKEKGIKKESNFKEIKECLGDSFKKEMNEFEVVSNMCPNCTAFLMRKILDKLLFIVLSKSDKHEKIKEFKENYQLPQLSELINMVSSAEIDHKHVISPKTLQRIKGAKFLGDNAAHNYLASVSFEDITFEISYWRTAIKELSSFL